MIEGMIKRFVKDYEQIEVPKVRAAYGTLAGALGIALNLLLFSVKLPIGIVSHSMGIVSDAFNNLSDMGSAVIALIGMRMSEREPDAEHPFGHGRMEYIASLLVALLIVFMGIELVRESVPALFAAKTEAPGAPMIWVMGISCGVKLWMMHYNRVIGERIGAGSILAAGKDSRNDVLTTAAVLIAALLGPYVAWPLDALAGIGVAGLILRSGYLIAKETIDRLLGGNPNRELAQRIAEMVLDHEGIIGLHDMILHDYGPGRTMASVHAEVPDVMDIHRAHALIDDIEGRIKRELGVQTVIHMDPVAVGNAQIDRVRGQLERTIEAVDGRMSMHDFRMIYAEQRINLIFDLVMPFEMTQEEKQRAEMTICGRMQTIDPRYKCMIEKEESYLG